MPQVSSKPFLVWYRAAGSGAQSAICPHNTMFQDRILKSGKNSYQNFKMATKGYFPGREVEHYFLMVFSLFIYFNSLIKYVWILIYTLANIGLDLTLHLLI